jgi:glutaredoxin 3
MPEIEIYTQPWRPFCARAVNLLTKKRVAFREIDAPHGPPARAESIRRAGGRTSVPRIFIAGRHTGGSDELLLPVGDSDVASRDAEPRFATLKLTSCAAGVSARDQELWPHGAGTG